MYEEGRARPIGLRAGDQVRVPNPHEAGTVAAVVVTPAEPGSKVRNAWIRYTDGPEAGQLARVESSYIDTI